MAIHGFHFAVDGNRAYLLRINIQADKTVGSNALAIIARSFYSDHINMRV
jgi:hypothetical protein